VGVKVVRRMLMKLSREAVFIHRKLQNNNYSRSYYLYVRGPILFEVQYLLYYEEDESEFSLFATRKIGIETALQSRIQGE